MIKSKNFLFAYYLSLHLDKEQLHTVKALDLDKEHSYIVRVNAYVLSDLRLKQRFCQVLQSACLTFNKIDVQDEREYLFTSNVFISKVVYKVSYPSITLAQARLIAEFKLESSFTNIHATNNKKRLIFCEVTTRANSRRHF